MSKTTSLAARTLSACKRFGSRCAAYPFAIPGIVAAVLAAILGAALPRKLEPVVNELSFAVARRIAGTGIADLAPTKSAALSLLTETAGVMLLYLAAVWFAFLCARRSRDRLQQAVAARKAARISEGAQLPEDREKEISRDIACLSAAVAAVPEWLMLAAGILICLELLQQLPMMPALTIPVTAVAVCYIRDHLRAHRFARAAQATVITAIWAGATLAALVALLQQTDPVTPLGTVVRFALTMALAVPTALLLPYRSIGPIVQAAERLRGFLK